MIDDAIFGNRIEEIGALNQELAKLQGLIAKYGERERTRKEDATKGH